MDIPDRIGAVYSDSEDGAQTKTYHIPKGTKENNADDLVDGAQTEAYHNPMTDSKIIKEDIILDCFATSKQKRIQIQQSFALEKIVCLGNGLNIVWAPYTFIASVTKAYEMVASKFLVLFAICFTFNLFVIKSHIQYQHLCFTTDVRSMGRYLLVSLLQIPSVSFILISLQAMGPTDLLLQVILLMIITLECVFCVTNIRKEWKRRQYERRLMS